MAHVFDTQLEGPLSAKDLAVSAVVGAIAFPSMLGLAQVGLFRPMRLTCGSGLMSSVIGGASVFVGGCVATLAAVKTLSLMHTESTTNRTDGSISFTGSEVLLSSVCGAVLFRALGGRFSSVLPSSLVKPGAFSREWIPAKGVQYATDYQKELIQQLGRKHGCHTCGQKRVAKFLADHQPPSKLVKSANGNNGSVLQKFFPHCGKCSLKQAGVLAQGNGQSKATVLVHPFMLRSYHLFLPLPFGIAYLKSQYSTGGFLATSSSQPVRPVSQVQEQEATVATSLLPQTQVSTSRSATLKGIFTESDFSNLVTDFPLLIIWNRIVGFLDSFRNPGDAFHVTVWFFIAVAALGSL